MKNAASFFKLVNNPFKFNLYLLAKLPSAFFSGVRVEYADEKMCTVRIPFKWFTQNPFKSVYFACLSMAAEMSTGVLAMAHLYKLYPGISMLVTKVECTFLKKATSTTFFTCYQGEKIQHIINECIRTKKPQSIVVETTGKNKSGDIVTQFFITWSFKEI